MPNSIIDVGDPHALEYILTHIFCPLRLPDGSDYTVSNEHVLAGAVCVAARAYTKYIGDANMSQWGSITRMLGNLRTSVQFERLDQREVTSQLLGMNVGDVLTFLIRAQNAAVTFRKQEHATLCESMEVSPAADAVMAAQGKLICSYPGPAIEVPNHVFDDETFQSELANFLSHMHEDVLDSAATSTKAQTTVVEERDTSHPRYITELLTGILRGVGRPVDTIRISKRVGDDVVWNNSRLPWRRSSLWLVIRVVLQTSLERSAPGVYKEFMIFFMCSLAKKGIRADISNDFLHCISTKISRRLAKLGSSSQKWLSSIAGETCEALQSVVEKRWLKVQVAQSESSSWAPFQLDLVRDARLSLPKSRTYIRNALANDPRADPSNAYSQPNHHSRGSLDNFLDLDGRFFEKAYQADPFVALHDVEKAVEQGIDGWVDRVVASDKACTKLEILANKYSSSAKGTYANDPEQSSIMLLTMVELWIAIDKLTVRAIPMLADYSPEVPTSLLESLLVRKAMGLDRLRRAFHYLSHRHSRSRQGRSVFSEKVSRNSFAVCYYEDSPHLQALKSKIEAAAEEAVERKVAELEMANARYSRLQEEARDADHTFQVNWNGDEYHAKKRCHKCQLEKQLRGMKIEVHEWPLPAARLHAEAVVFELNCPISFQMWRSATFHLLLDVCSPSPKPTEPYTVLDRDSGLSPFLVSCSRSRISLASNTKPFVKTHYNHISVPTTKNRVCVNNGLTYYGYDTHSRIPVSGALSNVNVNPYCQRVLPSGPYENLQRYVDATTHTSNEVLASQADCHKNLSIHEFISFGHLRSGSSIQWLNILRELRDRTLTFNRPEVHLLLAQAASQVGPFNDGGELIWHQEIQQTSFCYALLGELERLALDVGANWLEGSTMGTISFLLGRLLASSPHDRVTQKALELLRTVRQKTYGWVQELSSKATEASAAAEYRRLLLDTAAICRSTFDVDPSFVKQLLRSPEDVKILLSCAIFIHDNIPADTLSLSKYSQLLLARDRRFSLASEIISRNVIKTDVSDEGIDLAIHKVWHGYRPGSKWVPLVGPKSRWIECQTGSSDGQCSQLVRFNLLDGTLLVDGKPFSRLPTEIVQHSVYRLLFGEQVFDIIPSDLPGMTFLTRGLISNHQVHFALRGNDLIIKAKHVDKPDIIQLIPPEKLKKDLPVILVEGHVHWLNLSTSTIEIRPLDKLWENSSENWEIVCTPGNYHMRKGCERLLDIRSQTWTMVSTLLSPLDISENLIITVSPPTPTQNSQPHRLSVTLPRYSLSFFVDEDGELQSRNIRGMVYDADQSIGSLFGLVNKLVLRPKRQLEPDLIPRCILIPDGPVSFVKHGQHVRIEIGTNPSSLERVTYHTYRVDTELGCLTGNVSLTNKLYRAYLHALTSGGSSVDPLTGRTGTEEALSILRSAGCLSISRAGRRDAELLHEIASLCPLRTWYPEHLRHMQKVEWLDLSVIAQHHELYIAAKAIKEHCEKVQMLYENHEEDLFQNFPLRDTHLLMRTARREVYLLPPDVSDQLSAADVRYQARDVLDGSSAEHRAYTAAYSIFHPTSNSPTTTDVLSIMESWKATVSSATSLSLRYDSSWLHPDLPSIWIPAYNLLRQNSSPSIWVSLYNFLRGSNDSPRFQLLFSLSAMAYASPKFSDHVPTLVAFATRPQFCSEDPPMYVSYTLSDGYQPSRDSLRHQVWQSAYSFEQSPESEGSAKPGESISDLRKRQRKVYDRRLDQDVSKTVNALVNSWPCETPPPISLSSSLYNVTTLTLSLRQSFSTWYRNLKLKEHLSRVEQILRIKLQGSNDLSPSTTQYRFKLCPHARVRKAWSLTTGRLLARPAPSLPSRDKLPHYAAQDRGAVSASSVPLQQLVSAVYRNATDSFQRDYALRLLESANHFGNELSVPASVAFEKPTTEMLRAHYFRSRNRFMNGLEHLKRELGPENGSEDTLFLSGQRPRITAYILFRFLASTSRVKLSKDWKKCLIDLALLALELQRARRLLRLHIEQLPEEFFKELENKGCDGWNAEEYPDWLLIQLQGNFLVRHVQVKVASQMISPQSGKNTAMQLNMGEGKSSVIAPIVVAALADGNQIVRVIVPKALTTQTFQVLVDRLGGLANRRVYYLPFSRSLNIDARQVGILHELMEECMRTNGVLVAQPEHILSLKLVSVEKQLPAADCSDTANRLLQLQKWLHSHARDILDESDEILHVRYQLVYTIGSQQHVEGFPERWTTTQQVLHLVKTHASSLRDDFPLSVDYEHEHSGSFPHIHIMRSDGGEALVSRVVQDVMDGFIPNISLEQLPSRLKDAITTFVSSRNISSSTAKMVEEYTRGSALWNGLLLLRGLLATGILLFAFTERRWRVDYGLAPHRTMLAVPYRAKDVPAQRAEFGHPDVAIILTCLSYYYGGLTEEQLKVCFELLFKQDDPTSDYESWVQDCPLLPDCLRSLSGVNIKSSEQWHTYLFPFFARNQATIDFYLSRVVFPREAKEFPSKLSCSGWDLAENKQQLTTGFSGTNDGRYLLPMSINQDDPDHQRGTNARVLAYLLQPENNFYMVTTNENGERWSTLEFLDTVASQQPEIRVLLDVGAQMLDLQNHDLAAAWLDRSKDAAAAVYFNDDDEVTVLTRDGNAQLLLSSPFAQQLDQCIVYLDDAHTRGTDMKLPSRLRAAVTLGPKVTKDRLTQGCMRMRKLGHSHSVMFFAPLEVDRSIRAASGKENGVTINTTDILHWAIRETCKDIQHRAGHWAQQGVDHTSRYRIWSRFCENEITAQGLSDEWLQPEAKSLVSLYSPNHPSNLSALNVPEIRERCKSLGVRSVRDVGIDEEQEREVTHEIERERQVERPAKASPATHSLHQDVISFVTTGIVPTRSNAFIPIFNTLQGTSAVTSQSQVWSPFVLATKDYCTTVKSTSTRKMDEFLRPAHWVVSGKKSHQDFLVLLSPYEADCLMPSIRLNDQVHLHLYTPRTAKSMKPCDDLKLYSIPTLPFEWVPPLALINQLNAFAGQLYFSDYAAYIRLCRFLGVYSRDLQDEEGIEVQSDGFIARWDRPVYMQTMYKTFTSSPLPSLRVLTGLRRKGMRFAPTHIGKLLDGRLLSERDFDDNNDESEREGWTRMDANTELLSDIDTRWT